MKCARILKIIVALNLISSCTLERMRVIGIREMKGANFQFHTKILSNLIYNFRRLKIIRAQFDNFSQS